MNILNKALSLPLFSNPFYFQMLPTLLCWFLGHNWRYKDTTKWIKLNGERYTHTKTRRCIRCDQRDYLYDKWIPENDVPRDDKESIF